MGISSSKNISNDYKENKVDNEYIKSKNIDIKNNSEEIIIDNNSYYTNSFHELHSEFINDNNNQDIEDIFTTYKIEFSTKSKTRRIIEKFNKDNIY